MGEDWGRKGKRKKMAITNKDIEKMKEVLDVVEKKFAEFGQGLGDKINGVEKTLGDKIDKSDKKHDANATALYDLMQDVKKDVNRVENKLDEHVRQPAHVV